MEFESGCIDETVSCPSLAFDCRGNGGMPIHVLILFPFSVHPLALLHSRSVFITLHENFHRERDVASLPST